MIRSIRDLKMRRLLLANVFLIRIVGMLSVAACCACSGESESEPGDLLRLRLNDDGEPPAPTLPYEGVIFCADLCPEQDLAADVPHDRDVRTVVPGLSPWRVPTAVKIKVRKYELPQRVTIDSVNDDFMFTIDTSHANDPAPAEVLPTYIGDERSAIVGILRQCGQSRQEAEGTVERAFNDLRAISELAFMQAMLEVDADELGQLQNSDGAVRDYLLLLARYHYWEGGRRAVRCDREGEVIFALLEEMIRWRSAGYLVADLYSFAPDTGKALWTGVLRVRAEETYADQPRCQLCSYFPPRADGD